MPQNKRHVDAFRAFDLVEVDVVVSVDFQSWVRRQRVVLIVAIADEI